MNISYLRSRGMTAFTVDYLLWHHFGARLDECSDDILRQYRSYFHHHPNPANLAGFIESYLKSALIILIAFLVGLTFHSRVTARAARL